MNDETYEGTNKTLCLVRLRENFRFTYSEDGETRRIYTKQMRGAFATRQEAQTFIQNHAPVDVNPFAVPYGFYIEQDEFTLYHDEVEDDGFDDDGHIPESVGFFDTDDGEVEGFISVRADSTTTSFTDFAALCTAIGVVSPVLPAYDFSAFLNQEQTRQAQVEKLLPQWWEDQKDSMTNEQKATIWRKLHPRPYEIVPVPLER